MSCKESEYLVHLLNKELDSDARIALEQHLAGCESCCNVLEEERSLWQMLAEVPDPEPSVVLEKRFNAMMDGLAVNESENRVSMIDRLMQIFAGVTRLQLAVNFVFLLSGAGIAWFLFSASDSRNGVKEEIAHLSKEVKESRQLAVLSLLQNSSATSRIQGVGYVEKMKDINDELIEALVNTLNNDPSVSVRLMTLETLAKFGDEPKVRTALVESISYQDSPLLLAAIADVMVHLKEKDSRNEFEKVLEKKDLDTIVRKKLQQSVFKLT